MKSRKIWKTVLIALGCALGAWAFGALLLPVLLPFFIGLAVSLLAEKPVRLLQTRAHVPRSLASGLCVLLLFGLLFGGLFFLCRLLCAEAADLARQLPQLAENLAPLFEKLKSRLLALAERLPDGLGTGLRAGVEEFFKTGAGFGTKLYETLFSWASGIIGRLERMPLFFRRMKQLLAPGGCVLVDSSDLRYIYEDEDGALDIDLNAGYYGELDFRMQYKRVKGAPFPWLYVDFDTLAYYAQENGFRAERLQDGEHYDYLARLSVTL